MARILQAGDYVKYTDQLDTLDKWGFKFGQCYECLVDSDGSIFIKGATDQTVRLLFHNGTKTLAISFFTRVIKRKADKTA